MKKAPRVLAALLAALLLASCGSGTTQTDGTSDSTGETSTEPEETKDPLMDDLGEYDFGGYEYRVLSAEYDPNGTFVLFDTEEETGEVLVDSLYKRNREIEERFNIKFVASEDNYDNNFKTLRQTALAQEDAYDMDNAHQPKRLLGRGRRSAHAGIEAYSSEPREGLLPARH